MRGANPRRNDAVWRLGKTSIYLVNRRGVMLRPHKRAGYVPEPVKRCKTAVHHQRSGRARTISERKVCLNQNENDR